MLPWLVAALIYLLAGLGVALALAECGLIDPPKQSPVAFCATAALWPASLILAAAHLLME